MIRTKYFLVASIGLIVSALVLWVLNTGTEVSPPDRTTPVVFITSEPQEFSIMKDNSDNSKIKRAIFIEKIRNVLKRNPPPPPEPVEPEYVPPTFSLPANNIPSVSSTTPTTTDISPILEASTTPSTTIQTLPIN